MIARLRLVVFGAIAGALIGLASYAFLEALDWATRTRIEHGWLVWLLPVVGLAVGAAYHYLGTGAKGGTPSVIEQGHLFTHGVSPRMAPLIFGGSVAGHVAGASVGREGAALQLAGSVTDTAARLARLSHTDRRTLIAASLAGGWGAVFGVPVTGIAFMLAVTRRHSLPALVPAASAAFTGKVVVDSLGYDVGNRLRIPSPDWTIGLPFKLVVAGLVMGVFGRGFVWSLFHMRRFAAHVVRWPPARPIIGAVATLGLIGLVGRDYLGLSLGLLDPAYAGGHIDWWVPVLKLVFTAVALGTGFVGGEVAPLFVIGATAGGAIAPGLDAPGPLLAMTGTSAVFSSAAGVMLTGVVLTVEQFGWNALIPAAIVCAAARLSAGKPGLYVASH